jgi:hypothetical protein
LEADKLAAKYYDRLIVIQLGMDVGTGLASFIEEASGPWTIPTIRNLHTILAGTQPTSLPVEIENQPSDAVTHAFAMPNGDTLLAIWTDGVAIEDDPGVRTTLTLPGMDAQAVTAIDPLFGFEQELVTESENGNLIVRNLLVKDYPVVIRFAASAP